MFGVMLELSQALLEKQVKGEKDKNFGAIWCDACQCYHTRAAESIFPWAVCFKKNGEEQFARSALDLGNWLINQQSEEGYWLETPGDWTGTTVFQLMSLAAAYPILENAFNSLTKRIWLDGIKKAAGWLAETIDEKFASINYLASTAAALELANVALKEKQFSSQAARLAEEVVAKINQDELIEGEGPYHFLARRKGVDIGYNFDMTLGTLAIYTRLTGNDDLKQVVLNSLRAHLFFVYPDGSIDNSWGSRSYKWTTYGSKTAHGLQMALEILTAEDKSFRRASELNLTYLKGMIRGGLVGDGPHCWEDKSFVPCIYPTFVRAVNLAFALEFGSKLAKAEPVPPEKTGWVKLFPSVSVALVRSENLMGTVSACPYDFARWLRRKRTVKIPSGGALTYLWHRDFGLVQAGTQVEYETHEPLHMPKVQGTRSLTPRIQCFKENKFFTNLYDLEAKIKVNNSGQREVRCSGQLRDENFDKVGVRFNVTYGFDSNALVKTYLVEADENVEKVEIIEPIACPQGSKVSFDKESVVVKKKEGRCTLKLLEGEATIQAGKEREKYWCPLPYLKAYPIYLNLGKLSKGEEVLVKYLLEFG